MSRPGAWARSAALLLAVAALVAAAPAGATVRASLPDIENEVMCPSCGEALAVSHSSQGEREVALIRRLIKAGQTKAQIEAALVSEFGPAVLALPRASGVNLLVYAIPIAVTLGGGFVAVMLMWRWRSRRDPAGTGVADQVELTPAQRDALARDMGRYALTSGRSRAPAQMRDSEPEDKDRHQREHHHARLG
jgi:cytochrome c-type biogenesis protein CcmH/NrfF